MAWLALPVTTVWGPTDTFEADGLFGETGAAVAVAANASWRFSTVSVFCLVASSSALTFFGSAGSFSILCGSSASLANAVKGVATIASDDYLGQYGIFHGDCSL